MHQVFHPLNQRQYMLLLTTLTVWGSEAVKLFRFLPDDDQRLLNEKAEVLAQIPVVKRVPFLVKEMKEELRQLGMRGIEYIDPSWLISVLKGEMPRTIAALLVGLPAPLVRKLIELIPSKVRQYLPPKDEVKDLSPELLRIVRFLFEQKFYEMPRYMGKEFEFKNLLLLDRHDLYLLIRALGTEELAQAFTSVGKRALGELCRRLPKHNADELIEAVKSVDRNDAMALKTAQRFLARVLEGFNDVEELFQKAGLFRLSVAAQREDQAFNRALGQRIPKDVGTLYLEYVAKAADIAEWQEPILQRLQNRVLTKVKDLSEAGVISSRYAHLRYRLHDVPDVPAEPQPSAGAEASAPKPA